MVQKSCTSWLIISYLSAGAGFLNHQQYHPWQFVFQKNIEQSTFMTQWRGEWNAGSWVIRICFFDAVSWTCGNWVVSFPISKKYDLYIYIVYCVYIYIYSFYITRGELVKTSIYGEDLTYQAFPPFPLQILAKFLQFCKASMNPWCEKKTCENSSHVEPTKFSQMVIPLDIQVPPQKVFLGMFWGGPNTEPQEVFQCLRFYHLLVTWIYPTWSIARFERKPPPLQRLFILISLMLFFSNLPLSLC